MLAYISNYIYIYILRCTTYAVGPRATLGAAVNAADAYVDSLLKAHPLFGGFEGRPGGLDSGIF